MHAALRECLERLSAPQRAILRGYYFDEQSVEQLGVALNRSTEAVYKTLQRLRRAIKECVERKVEAAS